MRHDSRGLPQRSLGLLARSSAQSSGTLTRANTKTFQMTSDEYFANNSPPPAQMALIDGMHQFEYALRDLQNLERTMHPTGTIFVHDVVPLDERTATRERKTVFWSGDVC
jgi:hypothetical protein